MEPQCAALGHKCIRFLRQNPRFLRLGPGIYLNKQNGMLALLGDFHRQGFCNFGPVHRFNTVKQGHRLTRLVRLQRPDQMQLYARILIPKPRPFGLGLLHPVFAKHALACRQHKGNVFSRERLGDSNKGHACRLPAAGAGGLGDAVAHAMIAHENRVLG